MATKKVRAVFVGAGKQMTESVAPAFHSPGASRKGVEVVAVADTNFALAQSLARRLGVPGFRSQGQALDECDVNAAVIVVPPPFHASEALTALRAGCHVFVEKPMATSVQEARAMLEEARARGLTLMVNYQYPRQIRTVLAALEAGLVGKRYVVRVRMEWPRAVPKNPEYWREPASGVLPDLFGHDSSIALAALGETATPLAVDVQGWPFGGFQLVGPEFATESEVSASVRCNDNRRAELSVNWAAHRQLFYAEVTGSDGKLEVPMMAAELNRLEFVPTLLRHGKPERLKSYLPTPTEEANALQAEAFADAVSGTKPLRFPYTPELALRVQELLDAARRSIERGGAEPVRRV